MSKLLENDIMIRKLALAAVAVFVGKKLLNSRQTGGGTGLSGGHQASGEHVPTDLLGDTRPSPDHRAPEAFRPDPHAISTPEEREAMRPVTIPLRH
ncbi:hypothetical protein C1T17_10150 [Sphingobium sp. SCG-1]|uniref:hypothetical protein n=1 Tax=Sphingobium sp. SCG-1 TaxID=2072936 RepID=UPI000CD681A8|nr:hypothetical protein [Sphingobium sp. SCG-1]AUW58410.1 hypothetical protein C1T17_10150 [Sphingobium sp. SCG-1]